MHNKREVICLMSVINRNHSGASIQKRVLVTLMCLTLATTLIASVTIYVDSESVNEWNKQIKIGSVSMVVSGPNIQNYVTDIGSIPGVNNVSGLESSYGVLSRTNMIYAFQTSGYISAIANDFMSKFPDVFTLSTGRWPRNESEIAIPDPLAHQLFLSVGWTMDYAFTLSSPTTNLTIVGTYTQKSGDLFSYYYLSSIGVVVKSLLNVNSTQTRVYVNIDKKPISPFDADAALSYISGISKDIVKLNPEELNSSVYAPFTVYDYLSGGIRQYLDWRDTARSDQVIRASGVILIVLLLVIMAVQYNLDDQNYEASFYRARGATNNRINLRIIREIFSLACLSGLLGTLLGIGVSRIALASIGYLILNSSMLFSAPLLITYDSIILILISSILLPSLAYLGIKLAESSRSRVAESKGRLGKASKFVSTIKWDLSILVISLALLFAYYTSGSSIQGNILFSLIIPLLPVPIYVSVGSLLIKGLERATIAFSRVTSKTLGKIPSSIGVRRIGKQARISGLVIMVLVLTLTLSWNSAIADVSIPQTKENHARFALGGDIVFHLKRDSATSWGEFQQSTLDTEGVIATSIVSIMKMFLSTGTSGSVNFIIMNPTNYSQIGYDKYGNRLNQTNLNSALAQLAQNPNGAIITQDLAKAYQLSVGSTFKAFKTKDDTDYFTFTIIAVVDSLTQPLIPASTYIPTHAGYSVGERKIWVNEAYISKKVNLVTDTYCYLTAATLASYNDTSIALYVLNNGGNDVIQADDWDSVDLEVDKLTSSTSYEMNRSVDSMLTLASILLAVGVLSVYTIEDMKNRKREVALLRAMGAETKSIAKIQMAEFLFIIIISIILLAGYAPIFIANSLIASLSSYTSWQFHFPIPVFIVIPLYTLITILSVFLIGLFIFISLMILLSSKVNLSEALDSAWALAGPYVEDEK